MGELALQGVGAAPGVMVGNAVVLDRIGKLVSKSIPAGDRPHAVSYTHLTLPTKA